MVTKWDIRFLSLAEHVSQWSKDPSTKVGAVIVRPDRTILSVGYNGFPRGVKDWPERLADRDTKYPMTVHAEANAIIHGGSAEGCTLYTWPFPPCCDCAGLIIQAGIKRVIAPSPTRDQRSRWGASFNLAMDMFKEAGVEAKWLTEGMS